MLTELHIKNFKSCKDLQLQPGRVTVLIGENGSGKSNILEGLAFASAAAADKLDHEFLASRGFRVPEPQFMRSAFEAERDDIINIAVTIDELVDNINLFADDEGPYARWRRVKARWKTVDIDLLDMVREVEKGLAADPPLTRQQVFEQLRNRLIAQKKDTALTEFLIYSPENTALRNFEQEGQILPLGIKGEGLFQLLKTLAPDRLTELRDNLRLIDWFEDLQVPSHLAPFERTLRIRDRYLEREQDVELAYFDQRSSNEGFLFLLFYFALFVSPDTPKMFAIDNVDASLNPKLCTELMRRLVALAKKYDKQVLITTHNPAVLDGLDLNDDEQRLFMVHRNSKGHTKTRRVHAPKPLGDEPPVKLSEAFLRGLIGGLPQNF